MNHDKHVIECWLKLYNCLSRSSYKVIDWPDRDSSKEAIDAVCADDSGNMFGLEHTLIQPFEGEKTDTARFSKTLSSLEEHPDLLQPGFLIEVSQPVGVIQKGTDWGEVRAELLRHLGTVLARLPEGNHRLPIKVRNCSFDLTLRKARLGGPCDPGKLLVGRTWPGEPGPELIIKALKDKVPKLSAFVAGRKLLLLEKDSIAGTIESQFEQLPDDPQIKGLLRQLDEVWSANTSCLGAENVIFTNQVWPDIGAGMCSLNLSTGEFWQRAC